MVATAIWLTGEGPAMRDIRCGTKASSEYIKSIGASGCEATDRMHPRHASTSLGLAQVSERASTEISTGKTPWSMSSLRCWSLPFARDPRA